ncbi:MAG: transporter ATP-binding protein, partial [Marmoricola sp.]|nr:transporter ATP-binding protein [Marmoricola sp.]
MTPPEPVVDVRSLHVRFGEVEAVAGVDLQAYAGHATALLGRNGAGKSTTMRVLDGVVPPSCGTVVVAAHDVRTDALAVKRVVGYCPDVGGLVPRATPWEHLQLSAKLRRLEGWEDRGHD